MSEVAKDEPIAFRAMRATDDDLGLYLESFARHGWPRDVAQLRWMHLENPTGRSLVELAVPSRDPDRLAAIYAVLPVWARVRGRRVLACQSLDTLTDENYRGRGLFVRMAREAYARASGSGVAFVYGFPNGESAHGFFSRLEWRTLDPLPFLVRPIRTQFVLGRLSPRLASIPNLVLPTPTPRLGRDQELRSVARFGPEHEAVWESFSKGVGVAIDRDAAYLNWRLRDKPHSDYHVMALYEAGRVLGFVAFTAADKHGGRIGYVLECIHLPDRSDAGRILARSAVRALAQMGVDLVLAWCGARAPNRTSYRSAGFVDFPSRLRPVTLHFGGRPLAMAGEEALLADPDAWYISYLDSDTV